MKYILFIKALLGYAIYPIFLKLNKKIIILGRVKIKGFPYIDIKNNSKLYLGKNVTLNSSNHNYHINMYNGVKILADGNNSEIHIGDNTRIHGTCLHAKSKIIIGKNCLIAANCQIIDNNGHNLSMDNPINRIESVDLPKDIFIKDNVWIAANCIILKGVTIGEGSVIGANSVVNKDIPPFSIAMGNPAQVIKNNK